MTAALAATKVHWQQPEQHKESIDWGIWTRCTCVALDTLQGVQGSHGAAHKREQGKAYDGRLQLHGTCGIKSTVRPSKSSAFVEATLLTAWTPK